MSFVLEQEAAGREGPQFGFRISKVDGKDIRRKVSVET
jgi:hypothetical protein